ncbi:MAG: ABC transporter permease subunit [Spirochaetales bacterium]|nr:ABC transporter permease subunit [Spirochaetales bacterium]
MSARWRRWAGRAVWLAALLGGWEAVRLLARPSPALYPSLGAIAVRLGASLWRGELLGQIGLSLALVVGGLALGVLLAFLAALAASAHPWVDELLGTLIAILHPLPGLALLPVIILWLGTGFEAILCIIVHSVLWPVATNLRSGYRSLPQSWRIVARNLGLPPTARFFQITLPGTAPFLLAGARIGWSRAWRALISAEMVFGAVGGLGGLGWFLYSRRVFMDTAGLFAGILVVIVLGVVVEEVGFGRLERGTVERWGVSA